MTLDSAPNPKVLRFLVPHLSLVPHRPPRMHRQIPVSLSEAINLFTIAAVTAAITSVICVVAYLAPGLLYIRRLRRSSR